MTTTPAPSSVPRSLAVLRERARSLDATREDVDALLEAMSRPVSPQEEPRLRADVLHLILDDPMLGGLRGGDGRRVDETAAQALLALGAAPARELSPHGQKVLQHVRVTQAAAVAKPRALDAGGAQPGTSWRTVVGSVLLAWGVVETGAVLSWQVPWQITVGCLGAVGLTMFWPGMLLRSTSRNRRSYGLSAMTLSLAIVVMLLVSFLSVLGGGSPEVIKQIQAILNTTLVGGMVRAFVFVCVLVAMPPEPLPAARPGRVTPPRRAPRG
jgi:hypothetical protein